MAKPEQDLLSLIGRDVPFRRVGSTNGGEFAGPCPFCGGKDRFRVWPEHPSGRGRWWCRQCGKNGDAIAYLVEHGEISTAEAGKMRHGGDWPQLPAGPSLPVEPTIPEPHESVRLVPPGPQWQQAARAFVAKAQQNLLVEAGALDWLHRRGLNDDTIRKAGLGWNPADLWQAPEEWGLSGGNKIWLPAGWVVPWEIGGDLWRVNFRRPEGDPKYIGPRGSSSGLYNADALSATRAAILVEGEIDALTVGQFAGDVVTPVATGSTSAARRPRWIARLAMCPRVLVSFDAEVDKGDRAAAWWVDILPNAKRWRPLWEDANKMAQDGVNLRSWVLAGLDIAQVTSEPGSSEVTNTNGPGKEAGREKVPRESLTAPWEGRQVHIEDLPEFSDLYGLRAVGSSWPQGAPCPVVFYREGSS